MWITQKLGSFESVDAYKKYVEFVSKYEAKLQDEEKLPDGQHYALVQYSMYTPQ